MTSDQILSLGADLADFLGEFADCFGRSEPRGHLASYVRGQLGGLQRKSVEPMALLTGVAPRTLQEFLNTDVWDHERARDRLQQIVARDHEDPKAIGIIDDSGHPKSGKMTPGVQRQYCGRLGKTAGCVVTVHLAFSSYDTRFRTMLDTELYLPKIWNQDRERCRAAGIPDEVVYRAKQFIGLELLDRAKNNGVHLEWITADIWYSQKPDFLAGLEQRQLRYVVEVPRNLQGWLVNPGAEPRYPARTLEELCYNARQMTRQQWTAFHIKNTDKGPVVWKVKSVPFWLCRDGQAVGGYHLIWAYDPLHPETEKWFLVWDPLGDRLETWLHVAFARWPVERTLEDKKSELGFSHFEVRKYQALMRHFYITMVSHLYLARATERLRGKNPAITLSQVRDAANALVTSLPFDPLTRNRYLQRVSSILQRTQRRNQQARRSHFRTRRQQLHALGLFTSQMASCVPP